MLSVFHRYLLGTYCILGTAFGATNTVVNQANRVPALTELPPLSRHTSSVPASWCHRSHLSIPTSSLFLNHRGVACSHSPHSNHPELRCPHRSCPLRSLGNAEVLCYHLCCHEITHGLQGAFLLLKTGICFRCHTPESWNISRNLLSCLSYLKWVAVRCFIPISHPLRFLNLTVKFSWSWRGDL